MHHTMEYPNKETVLQSIQNSGIKLPSNTNMSTPALWELLANILCLNPEFLRNFFQCSASQQTVPVSKTYTDDTKSPQSAQQPIKQEKHNYFDSSLSNSTGSLSEDAPPQVSGASDMAYQQNYVNEERFLERNSRPRASPRPASYEPQNSDRAFWDSYHQHAPYMGANAPQVHENTRVEAFARVIQGNIGNASPKQNTIYRNTVVEGNGVCVMGNVSAEAARLMLQPESPGLSAPAKPSLPTYRSSLVTPTTHEIYAPRQHHAELARPDTRSNYSTYSTQSSPLEGYCHIPYMTCDGHQYRNITIDRR